MTTRPTRYPPVTPVALALAALLLTPAAAHAQLDNLDKGTLIKGLADEGMSDLLLHLIEVDPPKDPVEAQQVKIGQLRIQYLELVDQADEALENQNMQRYQQLTEQSEALFDDVITQNKQLIADHRDHVLRPLWQTDLAELMLDELIQGIGINAGEFYEFGVPTAEQRELFESTVAEAYAQLVDADRRFFFFEGELPRRDDHTAKRINTGLWDRMMNRYWKRRTQYYLAQAAIYTSRLPDRHPYFQTLRNRDDQLIPPQIQETTPDAERQRLGRRAAEVLEPFTSNTADPYGIRVSSLALQTRGYTYAGNPTQGLETAQTLLEAKPQDLLRLVAHLAKGFAQARLGRPQLAANTVRDSFTLDFVQNNPLLRLLATDAAHRILLREAETLSGAAQVQAKEKAYQPYLDFLNDESLGDARERLRNYVYQRWVDSIPADADLSNEPALVVAAIGETARREGQNLWATGYEQIVNGNQSRGEQLQREAQPLIERAVTVLTPLLERDTLTQGVRAKALFNLGWATYFIDPQDPRQIVQACNHWLDLADQLPGQAEAQEAIETASGLLRERHANANTRGLVNDAYQRMVEIVLEKYPATDAAADTRVYHATNVLAPQAAYLPAAEMLTRVPADHPDYFVAQGAMIEALRRAWESAEGQDRITLGDRILEQAPRIVRATERSNEVPVLRARGDAQIALAQVQTARGNTAEAIAALSDLEEDFSTEPELAPVLQQGLAVRINALVLDGKLERATREAEAMMEVFPQDAAIVIDSILVRLEPEIEALKSRAEKGVRDDGELMAQREKDALQARAVELARTAEQLAQLLLAWANDQPDQALLDLFGIANPDEDPFADWLLARAPFKISVAKAKLLTGDPDGALELIQPLSEQFPDEVDLLLIYGDALMQAGGQENLIAAARNYDRIISGIQPDANGQYPEVYWRAWVQRLTISDRLNQGTEDIPLRVRQLKLYDPALGGEPYKSELERLAAKHG